MCFIFISQTDLIFATSGGVDDNGCHNSSEGYHCHDDGNTTSTGTNLNNKIENNIFELKNNIKTGETYNRIIKKLKEKRSCSRIYSKKERDYCYDILKEGDIYNSTEVLLKLKEKKNCDFFYSLKSDKSECEYLIKTQNIYSIEEMKKDTYSFTRCVKIRLFKKDYSLCKEELENKIKQEEAEKRMVERQQMIDNKFEKIRKVIDVIYLKNPKKIQKFRLQIFDVLPNLKEGRVEYEIIKKLDEYLRILTWVDFKSE